MKYYLVHMNWEDQLTINTYDNLEEATKVSESYIISKILVEYSYLENHELYKSEFINNYKKFKEEHFEKKLNEEEI